MADNEPDNGPVTNAITNPILRIRIRILYVPSKQYRSLKQ